MCPKSQLFPTADEPIVCAVRTGCIFCLCVAWLSVEIMACKYKMRRSSKGIFGTVAASTSRCLRSPPLPSPEAIKPRLGKEKEQASLLEKTWQTDISSLSPGCEDSQQHTGDVRCVDISHSPS
ncbi:hypothetical protein PAMA_021723 [Pampus argenteus]